MYTTGLLHLTWYLLLLLLLLLLAGHQGLGRGCCPDERW
jgi:hypothetical protein